MVNTKERPIALTAQEVNAVLAGDKTQHRVLVDLSDYGQPEFMGSRDCDKDLATNWGWDNCEDVDILYLTDLECQLGAIGDRLWVKERLEHRQPSNVECCMQWAYSSDNSWALNSGIPVNAHNKAINASAMPRWASRLLLEITDIRIERLNDISEQDAIAQGIKHIHADPKDRVGPNHFTKSNGWYHCSRPTAAEVFKEMHTVSDDYDKYGENPWVWVIEFKVIKENDDD